MDRSDAIPGSSTAAAQELRALLDAAVDAIVVSDAQGRIETFNRAAEQMFGYREREIVGRNVNVLIPGPEQCTGVVVLKEGDGVCQWRRS